ncbi:hypothetical protein N2152v2_009201 [Parachlorella kessleri]
MQPYFSGPAGVVRPTRTYAGVKSVVWDRLEIKLPDRAIERDIRIVQQRALALSSGHISLHGSQDTSSMDSDSSVPHAAGYHHPAGRRGQARSRAGSEQPTAIATEAAAAYPTSARGAADPSTTEQPAKQEQQQQFAGSVANQWRSRSASPFQFPPAPATTVAYHLQVGRALPPAKDAFSLPAVELGRITTAVPTLGAYPSAGPSQPGVPGLASADLAWEGAVQQVQGQQLLQQQQVEAAVAQHPAFIAYA